MKITPKKLLTYLLAAGITLSASLHAADEVVVEAFKTGSEKRVDNPIDAWMNACYGVAGKEVSEGPKRNGYLRRFDILSDDAKHGDFSIVYKVNDPKKQSAFGWSCGEYIDRWEVGSDAKLHLWFKIEAKGGHDSLNIVLYDTAAKSAKYAFKPQGKNNAWQEVDISLDQFSAQDAFNFNALRSVQIEAQLPKGARVWLDDIRFHKGDSHLGISDKTITQYMSETDATLDRRREETLLGNMPKGGHRPAMMAFMRGEYEKGNRLLDEHLSELTDKENTKKSSYTLYNPLHGADLPTFYFEFSSKGDYKPGSLSPEVEKKLLAAMKINDLLVNDIALTRHSTWNVVNSENHDYTKAKAMFYSQIFMHEKEYADQVYPNAGTTLGFLNFEDNYMHWIKVTSYAVTEAGQYSDGKAYTAKDHYLAWVEYWKEYMAERARHGFFSEQGANGWYGGIQAENFTRIYHRAKDKELRQQARMFLDLMYAKFLQDQTLMIGGGASSRGEPGHRLFDESKTLCAVLAVAGTIKD